MSFQYHDIDLPIKAIIPEIHSGLEKANTFIVKAATGAGKSTIVPITLLDASWLNGKKILLLEPRRLAAKTIAQRMADLLGESVGESIGYRIRFETRIGPNTQLEVLTEGIFTKMIQSDNALEDVGLVIFDEFHERSIHADVAMALCRQAQEVLRPDLRILVMSATIDIPMLAEMLQAETVESEGRLFPVEVKYTGDADDKLLPELTANVIHKAINVHEGDVLVFLPGQWEIQRCAEILKRKYRQFRVHMLYGQMPSGKQMAAILPDREGKRKIVLATNIAETSLTIEGIKIVVDSGYARKARFNPKSGLSKLETVTISKDSAEQRKGRAGRLSHGTCYRMWTKVSHSRMIEQNTPEIEEADLCNLVLELAHWGINDPEELKWLNPPPSGHYQQASKLLHELDALEDSKITAHGKALNRLPTHPRIAHMLLKAEDAGMTGLATDIAPLLEERDPLPPDSGIDINIRIEALRRYRKEKAGNRRLIRIEKMAAQYRRMFNMEADNDAVNEYETGLLIAYAYPERIASSRRGNNAQFQMANGKIAMAGHRDDLAQEPWLAIAHVTDREGAGKIFMASALDPKDLAPMVQSKEIISWDTRKGGLITTRDLRIGNIVLQSKPLKDADETAVTDAISKAIQKEGQNLLDWNEEVQQWQNRVTSLGIWNKEEDWPNVETDDLLQTNAQWLSPYLSNVKTPEDLKRLDLKSILHYSTSVEVQQKLDKLAPERMHIPKGKRIKLKYSKEGLPPVLAVRLQDVFGMTETPLVNNGRTSVLMHLLSPGYKVVQVTTDLKSFWQDAYQEVRKELRIRYKKHAWPEDPLADG